MSYKFDSLLADKWPTSWPVRLTSATIVDRFGFLLGTVCQSAGLMRASAAALVALCRTIRNTRCDPISIVYFGLSSGLKLQPRCRG